MFRMSAIDESRHAETIGIFVEEFNQRMNPRVKVNSRWVRMTPPTQRDFDMVSQDPTVLPFTRVGAIVDIWDVTNGFVSARAGGWTLMYKTSEFLKAFVRAVDPSEWKPFSGQLHR